MQKTSVKTLSIIDTLSELAHDETETSRLALPSPISVHRGSVNRLSVSKVSISGSQSSPLSTRGSQPTQVSTTVGQLPQVQIRNSKVSIPMTSPRFVSSPEANFSASRFISSSPNKTPNTSPRHFGENRSFNKINFLNGSPLPNGIRGSLSSRRSSTGSNTPKRNSKLRSSQSSSSSRGQTPDWIKEIFMHARRGDSEILVSSLEGLEPTLIRNLSDHLGNNLLHIVCTHGHLDLLPWLASKFGSEVIEAVNDENRNGVTPPVAAIKRGHLDCLKWLVRNFNTVRDRMSCTMSETGNGQLMNGKNRSLLHEAAKYGKTEIVEWLCDEIERLQLDIDQIDESGNTSLHMAIKKGNISTISALLNHGAQVRMQNKMGQTPMDCARLVGQRDATEFLLLYETSLAMARELSEALVTNEQLQIEQAELRGHFKELLYLGKRLSKEREEMSRELGKLQESVMELHDKLIMEIQVLTEERNASKRNGIKRNEEQNGHSTIDECTSLHERWRQYHRQWFFNNQVDADQKLTVAEDAFKKQRNTAPNSQSTDDTYSQRRLRDKLEEMRCLSSTPINGNFYISSSENEHEEENFVENSFVESKNIWASPVPSFETSDISRRKKMPTPTPSVEDSIYSSLSNDMYSKIGSPTSTKSTPTKSLKNKSPKTERRSSRETLMTKLRECALASESASVIEVIEPTSSEEEEFERSLRQNNLSWILESSRQSKRISVENNRQELEQLDEHFVDEVTVDGLLADGSQRQSKRKSNFLQKIGIKTSKWQMKKSPVVVRKDRNENESIRNGSDLDIEEHVLPDSFDDDVSTNEDKLQQIRSDFNEIRKKFETHGSDSRSSVKIEPEREESPRRNASLSPSSRKSMLRPGSTYRSSTTSASANSVAASEDSGIVVTQPRPTSSSSGKPVNDEADSPTTSFYDSGDSKLVNDTKLKSISTSDFVIKHNLSKIEEASPVASSRCSSSTGTKIEVKPSESVASKNRPAVAVRRKSSSVKPWYDVPSDEDPEVPEADSLASIITHRSSSEEEF